MARDTLDRNMRQIQDEVLLLGSMVEEALLNAMNALKRRDIPAAREIFESDRNINEKRYAIENAILIIIATQQPMARDLRMLAAVLEVTTELERMGDYAKGIAKVVIKLRDVEVTIPFRELNEMADRGLAMLKRSLSAFIEGNPVEAAAIPLDDDAVDHLYNKVHRILVDAMIANPATIDYANLLMWVAHNLERLADRVTNICERTMFIATGELMEMDLSTDEFDEDDEEQ
ncbi:MAG TPA: phosphate signaling complex protein PhoU [Anaerolineaceae bacterium]